MRKLLLMPCLFLVACLFAGLYGAVHNQISYSVSPEYFTKFKFHQFRVFAGVPHRVGAATVGWNAAWWMGLVIGTCLIPLGLTIRGASNYFFGMIKVFAAVAATTLIVGLTALLFAFALVDPETVGEVSRYGNEVVDDAAFMRAATMHNFSYIGGGVGIITGGFLVLRYRKRSLKFNDS